ncbi:MAG: bifunctional riboflavin kinase/FAD synthetase [Clostridiales bacterium]|jgi:riboflavin kinase/FMN adenylyltransferase|nr:bifunctional riboflavin kinase/FAD synthetase [Clostridiales bacterium]
MNEEKKVIALGFFDGVHRGHATLLKKAAEISEGLRATPAVLTFDVSPGRLVSGEKVELITSPEERAEIIRRYFGIEEIIVLQFDHNLMHMRWRDFISWLVRDFSAVHFVVGYDFRFGYKGEGNSQKLAEKCAELGLGCDVMPQVAIDGIRVSSTYIRELLSKGDMEKAREFLGHPHSLTDIVRFGYKLGSKMGSPTINMKFPENVLVPAHGVYATTVQIEDEEKIHYAVTNIGVRPTVRDESEASVESYILDFNKNIYGKRVRLEFHKMLRPEKKFKSVEELKEQIKKDAHEVRKYFKL